MVVVGSGYYVKNGGSINIVRTFSSGNRADSAVADTDDKCDGRQYCSQMSSYEEAGYFINNCPNKKWMVIMMVSLAKGSLAISFKYPGK